MLWLRLGWLLTDVPRTGMNACTRGKADPLAGMTTRKAKAVGQMAGRFCFFEDGGSSAGVLSHRFAKGAKG